MDATRGKREEVEKGQWLRRDSAAEAQNGEAIASA